jgi:peptide deformylase
MKYQLITSTDPRLRAISEPIDLDSIPSLQPLIEELSALAKSLGAQGISAAQVGVNQRLFIMNDSKSTTALINPAVVMTTDDMSTEIEGCLSFPNLYLPVSRPTWLNATWYNEDGILEQHLLDGQAARVFLHELDHLNGILFTDRVSRMKLSIAKRKMAKALRKART